MYLVLGTENVPSFGNGNQLWESIENTIQTQVRCHFLYRFAYGWVGFPLQMGGEFQAVGTFSVPKNGYVFRS